MKAALEDISSIKIKALLKFFLNFILVPIIIILLAINSTRIPTGLYIFLVFLGVLFGIGNLFLSISIIISLTSMYISSKNNEEEVVYQIRKFEKAAFVFVILGIFFNLIFDLIIVIITNWKIKFLEEKIKSSNNEDELENDEEK